MVKVKRIREKRLAKEKGKRWAGGSGTPENVELPRGETGGIRGGIKNVTDPKARVEAVNRARAREGLPLVAPPEDIPKPTGGQPVALGEDIPKPTGTPTPIPEEREIERNMFGLATPEEREKLLEERKARGSEWEIFKEQLPTTPGEFAGDILEAGGAASIPVRGGLSAIATGKKILQNSRKLNKLREAQVINRMARTNKISISQAEKIFGKSKLLTGKGLFLTAAAIFSGGFTSQGMVYWGSVDNLASSASFNSNTLLNLVTFGEMTGEEVVERKAEIVQKLDDAKSGAKLAGRLNPVTNWAFSKFYKSIVGGEERTVDFNFEQIDKIMENKMEEQTVLQTVLNR
jgi:hypothetical protein